MSVDCSDTIDTLGKLIFDLHRGINTVQAPDFKEWALQQIKPLLHFDKAIWAMGTSEDRVLHNVHMHGLPSEFMKNYEKFKSQDRLLTAILAQPGKALRTLDIYSQSEREELEIVRNHAKAFEIEDTTLSSSSESRRFSALIVKSISEHWSIGGYISTSYSTYSNLDLRINPAPAIEYNVFPYSQSTRRRLCFLYRLGYNYNDYMEETMYGKTSES